MTEPSARPRPLIGQDTPRTTVSTQKDNYFCAENTYKILYRLKCRIRIQYVIDAISYLILFEHNIMSTNSLTAHNSTSVGITKIRELCTIHFKLCIVHKKLCIYTILSIQKRSNLIMRPPSIGCII